MAARQPSHSLLRIAEAGLVKWNPDLGGPDLRHSVLPGVGLNRKAVKEMTRKTE
jgi:hypothetical protein